MFDLRVLIAAGMGRLRLPPELFWDCTPAEIMALLDKKTTAETMTRGRLEALMNAFPDAAGRDKEG